MFCQSDFSTLPPHLKWQTETVEPGESVTGMIAGRMQKVMTHWNGEKSLPCVSAVTGGKLVCLCALKPMSHRTLGYLPLITPKAERLVIPLSATVGHLVEQFSPGKVLRFSRPKKVKRPLSVSLVSDHEVPESWVKRLRPACIHDITEYLCHLWQIRQLTEHFGFEFRPRLAGGDKLNADPSGSH